MFNFLCTRIHGLTTLHLPSSKNPPNLNSFIMTNFNSHSFNCSQCPFEGQDCVYCRTCKHCDHEKHDHNRKKLPSAAIVRDLFVHLQTRKEVLSMSTEDKQIKVEQASKLAKWFKISIEISIFGHVIFSKTWPPQD